jgi:hypothetical protein
VSAQDLPVRWRAGIVQERTYRQLVAAGGRSGFLLHVAFLLHGPLDAAALGRAAHALGRRHPILRAGFQVEGDEVLQVVQPEVDLWLRIVAPAGDPDRWLRDWAGSEAQATFDVREAPLVRLSLAPLGPERHALLLVVDHLIGDGWTMRLLLEELARLYEAERGLATEPLPPPVHFAEYAERQRRDLAEAASADLLEHWRRRLPRSAADLCLRLPDFQAPPEPGGGRAVVHRVELDAGPLGRLRERAAAAGTTMFTAALACFALTLAEASGQRRLSVLTSTFNRSLPGDERVVGCLTHLVLVQLDLARPRGFDELVELTFEAVLDALEHERLPLMLVRRRLWPDTYGEFEDARRCLFALSRPWYEDFAIAGLRAEEYLVEPHEPARPGLEFWATERDDRLAIRLVHRSPDYPAAAIARLGERLRHVLAAPVQELDGLVERLGHAARR